MEGSFKTINWPNYCISNLLFKWAPSTLASYNTQMRKFAYFCLKQGLKPENVPEASVAEYFSELASTSHRPKLLLNTASATLDCYYDAIDHPSPVSADIRKLIKGSIKSGTVDPIVKSKIMP